jgi:hypothetical protein
MKVLPSKAIRNPGSLPVLRGLNSPHLSLPCGIARIYTNPVPAGRVLLRLAQQVFNRGAQQLFIAEYCRKIGTQCQLPLESWRWLVPLGAHEPPPGSAAPDPQRFSPAPLARPRGRASVILQERRGLRHHAVELICEP